MASPNPLTVALLLTLPLVVGGVIHMGVVKLKLLSSLDRPIDEARFGRNKTWRGFVAMPAATILGTFLASRAGGEGFLGGAFAGSPLAILAQSNETVALALLGLALGLAYVLFELPNSYVKRRLRIPPGKLPERNKALFFLVDHLDSTLGCTLVYALLLGADPLTLLICLFLGPTVHTGVSLALYAIGLRKNAL